MLFLLYVKCIAHTLDDKYMQNILNLLYLVSIYVFYILHMVEMVTYVGTKLQSNLFFALDRVGKGYN